jgi:hypothetical protein
MPRLLAAGSVSGWIEQGMGWYAHERRVVRVCDALPGGGGQAGAGGQAAAGCRGGGGRTGELN